MTLIMVHEYTSTLLDQGATTTQQRLKLGLITFLAQHAFPSLANEDPYNHLATFYDLCGTTGVTQTEEENLYMMVFHFSVIGDNALKWLNTHPSQSLITWSDIGNKFLDCFFQEEKRNQAKTNILSFHQKSDEPLCEACERYKTFLMNCPSHDINKVDQLYIFLGGLKGKQRWCLML